MRTLVESVAAPPGSQAKVDEMALSLHSVTIGMARLLVRWRCAPRLVAAGLLFSPLPSFASPAPQRDALSTLREKIDRAEKESMEICKTLGAIYEEIGDTDKAVKSYRMAFQVFPDDPFVCRKLIALCTAKERWAELVPVYKSLINANPGANETYMNKLAECYLKADQPEEAVAVIRQMLDEYGEDAADYRDAAQMLMSYEEYEPAASVCRNGIEAGFEQSSVLHGLLRRAAAQAGKYGEAISAYRKAIELSASQRERVILEQELAELCQKEPIIERLLEKKAESLQAIDERLAELYWQKALQEEKDGKLDAALVLYRRIFSLAPDSDRGKAAEKRIQELGHP